MLKRFEMFRCLKALESPDYYTEDLYAKYTEAIRALEDLGCVKVKYYDNKPVRISLTNHAYTYKLERSEIWFNRFLGFILGFVSGIGSSVLASIIISRL